MLGGVTGSNNFIYGAGGLESHIYINFDVFGACLGRGKLTTIVHNSVPVQEKKTYAHREVCAYITTITHQFRSLYFANLKNQ
jgi:RecA/RadA recombinase